jgi:dephospho-CoA kinase
MIVTGVTGGIGSGKSTLCEVWEELGARVVYADNLAKELMVTDPEVQKSLRETFGAETFHPDGSLNKPHLIREAFDKDRVNELNRIVHPAVHNAFGKICSEAEKSGEKMVVKEAALLLNSGRPRELDAVILVLSDRDQQIDRVKRRDRVEESDIVNRMKKQPDFETFKSYADYIIENNGTLEEFKQKSKELFFKLMREKGDV